MADRGRAGRYLVEIGDRATAEAVVAALRAEGRDAALRNAASLPAFAGEPAPDAVVAVGMGLAVPGASSPDEFWELLRDREPQFSEPGERMDIDALWSADPAAPDKTYTRTAGFIHTAGTDPRIAPFRPHPALADEDGNGRELSGRWLRHGVLQALEGVHHGAGVRTFAAVGMTADGGHAAEQSLLRRAGGLLTGEADPLAGLYPAGDPDLARTAPYRVVREALDGLVEPAETVVVDTACSSSLYSFDFGMRALREGRADLALCGGVYSVNAQTMVLFSKLDGLAKGGLVRSLDTGADGVLFSDGAAVVALKTYARAVADGDPVLGFVLGFGGSSDGRGKAVYAPNPAGQRIALERAWDAAGVAPEEIDWVVAHATGTSAGDQAEIEALTTAAPAKRWTLTSNKSLIGHTGWAAGAVNVVHALLALRHGVIPAQRLFSGPASDAVDIPQVSRAWPATADGRTAAVSAMGFGGTNAHLILGDRPRAAAPGGVGDRPRAAAREDLGDRPQAAAPEDAAPAADPLVIVASTATEPGGGAAVFGDTFPVPAPLEVRLPPAVLARLDLSQLMALRCALDLRGEWLKEPATAARTGLYVGHSGQVRQAMACTLRAYLDDIANRSAGTAATALGAAARTLAPEANSDSLPGLMPNIIASRVAQLLDVHGPNMTLDAGPDSSHAALAAACRELTAGSLDAAIVMGVAGCAELVRSPDERESGEAVAGVVLMRRSTAEALGLTPLGELRLAEGRQADAAPTTPRYVHGAEGLLALHRALREADDPVLLAPRAPGTPALLCAPAPRTPELGELRPYVMRTRWLERPEVRAALPAPGPDTLVLTNVPAYAPAGCTVLTPGETPADDPGALVTGRRPRHVHVVFDAAAPGALPLQELAFAAAHHCADGIEYGGSFAVLVLDQESRPTTGLFTGLVRALTADIPDALVYAVVTDSGDLDAALAQLAGESARDRHLGVAYYRDGRRHETVLTPEPARPARRELPPAPVIIATGGGRGITAELVDQLARRSGPAAIWLLGSGPEQVEELPADRPTALRRLMAAHPGEKIAALNRRYNRMLQAVERTRTVKLLQDRYGTHRVHYRQCDVTDFEAVRRIADEIGGADVVVHGAGVERASALRRKTPAEFRSVRDVKVRGWLNLRDAFAAYEPALWLTISSVTTVVARPGEADYISANEYLTQAAAHARAAGQDAHALVSGLWAQTGMVTHTQVQDEYLAREDNFTQLDDDLGRRYFGTELTRRRTDDLTTVWLGETEWRMLAATAPALRAAGELCGAFVQGEPVRQPDGAAVWELELPLDVHPYLRDHRVDGRPTLPGTFIMELAAEAAAVVGKGRPVAITDAVFSRFIRAAEEQWPRRLVVTAHGADDRVDVVVSSPPRGVIPAQEYSRMTVLLGSYDGCRATLPVRPDADPAVDPYALPDSPVRVSGIFDSVRDPRTYGSGGSARLHLPPPGRLGPLREFLLPALAMDSLLRATAATSRAEAEPAVPVPVGFERFDVYTGGNDAALGPVGLHYAQSPSRCEAVDAAGRVLFAFTGLTTRDKRAAVRLSEAGKGPR
ncbi:SDR family NAD(P)-dependent oxidoreductase [Streptomyces sp. NPDC051940]|uniref:SDR family NAD(P)-dependent oxidoreductase n=1 Tax=Streptomyces sp. NPDC051940 TaxID=3155675 RepID=UPI00342E10E4